jgi:hypothetical protein
VIAPAIAINGNLATVTIGDYLLSEFATDDRPWTVAHRHAPARPLSHFRTLGSAIVYAQRRQATDNATELSAWHRLVEGESS